MTPTTPYDDDDFLSALETSLDQRKDTQEPELDIPPQPKYDPITHIANIFAAHPAIDRSGNIQETLKSLFQNGDDGDFDFDPHEEPSTILTQLATHHLARRFDLDPSSQNGTTVLQDYALQLGKKVQYFQSVPLLKKTNPPKKKKTKLTPLTQHTPNPQLPPLITTPNPPPFPIAPSPILSEFLPIDIAAAMHTFAQVDELEARIQESTSIHDLSNLILFQQILPFLEQSSREHAVYEALADRKPIEELVTIGMLQIAQEQDKYTIENPLRAISHMANVIQERRTLLEDGIALVQALPNLENKYAAYTRFITTELATKGWHIPIQQIESESTYQQFVEKLTRLAIPLYKKGEPKPTLARHDLVMIGKPVGPNGTYFYYPRRTDIYEGGVGTIRDVRKNNDGTHLIEIFVDQNRDWMAFDSREVESVVPVNVSPVLQLNRRAEIVNDAGYNVSKRGSWGYIESETVSNYTITFEYITPDARGYNRPTWEIRKSDVTVTQIEHSKQAIAESRATANEQTGGLLTFIESLAANVPKKYRAQIDQKTKSFQKYKTRMNKLGIDKSMLLLLLEEHDLNVERLQEQGILPSENSLELLAKLKNTDEISPTNRLIEVIERELGCILPFSQDDEQNRFTVLKEFLQKFTIDQVVYQTTEKRPSFTKDTVVMSFDREKRTIGQIGRYLRHCGTGGGHVDFPNMSDVHIDHRNLKPVLVKDEFSELATFYTEGTAVIVRTDPQPATQKIARITTNAAKQRMYTLSNSRTSHSILSIELADAQNALTKPKYTQYAALLTQADAVNKAHRARIDTIIGSYETDIGKREAQYAALDTKIKLTLTSFGKSQEEIKDLYEDYNLE